MRRIGLVSFAVTSAVWGAEPGAMIRGGADASGQVYTWSVVNQHSAPLVGVSFPHYHGGVFAAPEGWDTSESTYLVGVGVEDRPGVCIARASSASDGIAAGQSAEFRLQLAPGGARRAPGEVSIQFADGSSTIIGGVELSHAEPLGDQYVTLIGLGVIFVAWLAFRSVRARRERMSADA